MLWYFILIAIICLDFFVEYLCKNLINKDTKSSKLLSWFFKYRIITILSIVFLSTFRNMSVGADNPVYLEHYNKLLDSPVENFFKPISNSFEIGYNLLTSLLALLGAPYRVMFFFISLIFSVSIVLFINKFSSNKLMSLILMIAIGTFAHSLGLLRQIVALSFILLAMTTLQDKKYISTSILFVLAISFHISAVFTLIIIPLKFIKLKPIHLIIISITAIVIALSFPLILYIIEALTPINYFTKYYIDVPLLEMPDLINILYSIAIIIVFMILYLCKFKHLKLSDYHRKVYDWLILLFFIVPLIRIVGLFTFMSELFNRLSVYFMPMLIILIPLFINGLKYNKKLYKVATIAAYIASGIYMYYLYAIRLSCGVVPYLFCF